MEPRHTWHFEVFDPRSKWIFVPVSDFAKSLGLYVRELGHFYQDGCCVTHRVPEDSFGLVFMPENGAAPQTTARVQFPDEVQSPHGTPGRTILFFDNRRGYTLTQQGPSESYFIQLGGGQAELFYRLFRQNGTGLMRETGCTADWIGLYGDLEKLYRQPANEARDLYARMRLTEALTRLVLENSVQPLYVQSGYVKRTLAILEERCGEALTLEKVADELHLSPGYLSRLLRAETGAGFGGCLAHLRLNRARELLLCSGAPVEEVALTCGFCNSSHFIRVFRRSEGTTPARFRRQRSFEMRSASAKTPPSSAEKP